MVQARLIIGNQPIRFSWQCFWVHKCLFTSFSKLFTGSEKPSLSSLLPHLFLLFIRELSLLSLSLANFRDPMYRLDHHGMIVIGIGTRSLLTYLWLKDLMSFPAPKEIFTKFSSVFISPTYFNCFDRTQLSYPAFDGNDNLGLYPRYITS